ncbi:hypothetical protein V1514DRAFT_309256 [Lipomyces japonicus]|uniref:uncharacterized protein n=1 Tax=Lipomyces japonicus TaxID=56871 RepID=UPI0034CD58D2
MNINADRLRSWKGLALLLAILTQQLTVAHAVKSMQANQSSVALDDMFSSSSSSAAAAALTDNCFNCLLPSYECLQFADCRQYDGHCDCPPGFGGDDCRAPLCGSLPSGKDRMPRQGDSCDCDDGWESINCNVCKTDEACNAMMPDGTGGTCYKDGLTIKENFQICDVTNRKILEILDGKDPQVTFSCNKTQESCDFQFWIDQVESFYCQLSDCQFSQTLSTSSNQTDSFCKNIECGCVPDRTLCGEDGSIDITDFLTEAITGPGSFHCDSVSNQCEFSEPAMDDLIQSVFGDEYITLQCRSGECLHYSELPDYQIPQNHLNKTILVGGIISILAFLTVVAFLIHHYIKQLRDRERAFKLPSEDESYKLMAGHTPTTLYFNDITYSVESKSVLRGIQGVVKPGEIMAIMGASGAGKTSLLDILAHKNKGGLINGDILVNGYNVTEDQFKSIVGFVDQEDALMPTLTVYETILSSALLRLPKTMSRNAKKLRVLETMNELGIIDIKDQLIGWEGHRGISGGEKRRVAIACELVTSPSIIFLDEPTSGLDSFNAFNVVECLQSLARNYKRTVIFTIHQPRSNIVALFDRLLLLSRGNLVYSGPQNECRDYFSSIGYACPPGFNLADFLIDLTMTAKAEDRNGVTSHFIDNTDGESIVSETNESATGDDGEWLRLSSRSQSSASEVNEATPLERHHSGEITPEEHEAANIANLVSKYLESSIAGTIKEEILRVERSVDNPERLPSFLYGKRRISIWEQFIILSSRTFKNLYRNPMLLLTHYVIATILAILCGFLYFDITSDISGFQNRLGLFFFVLALFGFSTLTTLNVFASERQIFMRERANGFYVPFAYFASKVVFDIIPLRVFPPVLLGLIIYPLIGLNLEAHAMAKFLLVLMLFNLASAAVCLFIGVMIKDTGVASLIGSLVMLFSMLFAGLFLNRDSIPRSALWLQNLSLFHYGLEALVVNEVRYLTLIEYKYGLSIEVPGATILSTFGFSATSYWRDVIGLSVYFFGFIFLAYIGMHFFLIEKR